MHIFTGDILSLHCTSLFLQVFFESLTSWFWFNLSSLSNDLHHSLNQLSYVFISNDRISSSLYSAGQLKHCCKYFLQIIRRALVSHVLLTMVQPTRACAQLSQHKFLSWCRVYYYVDDDWEGWNSDREHQYYHCSSSSGWRTSSVWDQPQFYSLNSWIQWNISTGLW